MLSGALLVVSTDVKTVHKLQRLADALELPTASAKALRQGAHLWQASRFGAVVVHIDEPTGRVREALQDGFLFPQCPPCMALASEPCIRDAVAALRSGAAEYVAGMPDGPQELERALERLNGAVSSGGCLADDVYPLALTQAGFLTRDHRLLKACAMLTRLADSRVPVVIEGESGSGKSALARAMHGASRRRAAPFLEFRCSGLPEQDVCAELFGRPRDGKRDCGRFENADGGTLLLDGVGMLPPRLQSRVIRAGTMGCFQTADDGSPVAANVRLVLTESPMKGSCAPGDGNCAMDAMLQEALTVRVEVPPLRERVADIPLLARCFLRRFSDRHGREVRDFTQGALSHLVRYPWPGNVTELKSAVEHAVVFAMDGLITPDNLPADVRKSSVLAAAGRRPLAPLKKALREPEKRYILRALEALDWNKQHTAEKLQISRSTLYKKLKQYGINQHEGASASQ